MSSQQSLGGEGSEEEISLPEGSSCAGLKGSVMDQVRAAEMLVQVQELYQTGYAFKKMPVPRIAMSFFVDSQRRMAKELEAAGKTLKNDAAYLRMRGARRAAQNLEGAGHARGGVEVANLARVGKIP